MIRIAIAAFAVLNFAWIVIADLEAGSVAYIAHIALGFALVAVLIATRTRSV